MDCLKRDAPVETVVQLMFEAGTVPGLRDVILLVRGQVENRRAEIEATGAILRLAGGVALSIGYDRVGHAAPKDVLTLAFRSDPAAMPDGDESRRLGDQTRLLQTIVTELGPEEEHWHVLPGPLAPQDSRRLAMSSAQLLSATRRFRRPQPPAPVYSPLSRRAMNIANDMPQLPRPKLSEANRILERLARHGRRDQRRTLTLVYSKGLETTLRFGIAA